MEAESELEMMEEGCLLARSIRLRPPTSTGLWKCLPDVPTSRSDGSNFSSEDEVQVILAVSRSQTTEQHLSLSLEIWFSHVYSIKYL